MEAPAPVRAAFPPLLRAQAARKVNVEGPDAAAQPPFAPVPGGGNSPLLRRPALPRGQGFSMNWFRCTPHTVNGEGMDGT
ncbi:brain protein I3 [Platysternon megacephalum]|uniref:Brain protein I3 n=1 Tax=Platysternon megacephalum TaxID=55544 RepID=A0A4D9E8S5_9SAUR|nr:brain protein I3 [Platysternon megacephalum]